ncbi:MAG: PIN domain nuclease [Acidobacteria bacterium]|nr:PIN domain nuclease [Acidobacteriota bacterium]
MGAERARPVVLDTGALIAFERNDRRVRTLVELAVAHHRALHAPAGVIAQAWRDGRTQARIARLLGSDTVNITALDGNEARAVGVLCRETGTSDVVDASVVLVARRYSALVVTSDPGDIGRIDASLDLVAC